MRFIKTSLIAASVSMLALGFVACSKDSGSSGQAGQSSAAPQASQNSAELLKKLPADTLGFASFNLQAPGVQEYLKSAAYKGFMNGMQAATQTDPNLAAGMKTYFSVLEAIGVMPQKDSSTIAYSDGVVFAVPKEGKGVDISAIYNTNPGIDARTLLTKTKAALGAGNIKTESVQGSGYEAISISPFEGATDSPVTKMYRDGLGIQTVYLAANEKTFSFTTNKALLERAFTSGKDEAKAILEGANFKKAMASITNRGAEVGYGFADITTIVTKYGQGADVAKFPVSAAVFSASMKNGPSIQASVLAEPKDKEQEQIFAALNGSSKGATLSNLPAGCALGLAVDGSTITRLLEASAKDQPADPGLTMAKEMLTKVSTLSVGVRTAVAGGIYPDLIISASSTDSAGLLSQLKNLSKMAPLPQGMSWQSKTEDGFAIDSLPTPFGAGIYLSSSSDAVVIASTEVALKDTLKSKSASLEGASVVKNLSLGSKSSTFMAYINYPGLQNVMASSINSLKMFAPGQAGLDPKQFEYMKYSGEVALSLGFEPGVVRFQFGQELPKS